MIILKLIVMAVCAGLFFIGGWKWHNARRFIMPVVLVVSTALFIHHAIALTMLVSMGFLTIGYGDNAPLRHCFGNGWGRGIWGLLVALSLSVGLFVSGHIVWYFLIPYLAVNFTFENALKDIPQCIGDPIIGLGFSSIILLVH